MGQIIKEHRDRDEIEEGIMYELECKFIDLRAAKLENKLKYLKNMQMYSQIKEGAVAKPLHNF